MRKWRLVYDNGKEEVILYNEFPETSRTFTKHEITVAETVEEISEALEKYLMNYPLWEVGIAYTAGEILEYDGLLYEVLQSHTSQDDWRPDTTASLFDEYIPDTVIVPWEQPEGAHDAYDAGNKVLYSEEVWESTIDANVWSPDDYPQGWEKAE